VRYRFRGLARTTGKPLEGHAEAASEEEALANLSDNGIVTESIWPDPKPAPEIVPAQPKLANAIDSALDVSSTQVPFDKLVDRYKGKSVWVIDRDKIRRNVAEVVDAAMRQSAQNSEGEDEARRRVAQAIDGLFRDNRNLTSQASATNASLEKQLARLENFVLKAEGVLAAISVAARNLSSGGGVGLGESLRNRSPGPESHDGQNAVLLEIFKDNLRLRGIELDTPLDGDAPVAAAPPHPDTNGGETPPLQTNNDTPNTKETTP